MMKFTQYLYTEIVQSNMLTFFLYNTLKSKQDKTGWGINSHWTPVSRGKLIWASDLPCWHEFDSMLECHLRQVSVIQLPLSPSSTI